MTAKKPSLTSARYERRRQPMRNALSPIKMMIVAVLFSVGLSGAAQADVVYLKCGFASIALDVKNKKIIKSTHYNEVARFDELEVDLRQAGTKKAMRINRINLEYAYTTSLELIGKGVCQLGRKF